MSTTGISEAESRRRAALVRAALPSHGLFEGKDWRVGPEPLPLAPAFAAELEKLGFRLRKFLEACNLLYHLSATGRQPGWIAELLDRGKPPGLVAFGREKIFRGDIPQVLRPDILLTEDGFVIAEIDSVPGGLGLTDWLNTTYAAFGCEVAGGSEGMLEGFRAIMPGGDILVSEEAATYRPEMEWLAARLNARYAAEGLVWRVLPAEEEIADPAPRAYRFFELFDLHNIPGAVALQRRALAGEVRVTPPFKPWLEEKMWFAFFWMRPLAGFWRRELGERHDEALRRVIPRTWIMDPAPLPPQAVYPGLDIQDWKELQVFTHKQRQLLLKVSGFSEHGWGSRGVEVGQDMPQPAWAAAVEAALQAFPSQPRLLQQFHHPRLVSHAWVEAGTGEVHWMKGRVRLCPYYFAGDGRMHFGGALATVCPADKKLIHGMTDAIMVPAAVVDREG